MAGTAGYRNANAATLAIHGNLFDLAFVVGGVALRARRPIGCTVRLRFG
jgi:hypothetical protein